jgi:hypothetical protein
MRVSIFLIVLLATLSSAMAQDNYVTKVLDYKTDPYVVYIPDVDFAVVVTTYDSDIKFMYNYWFCNGQIIHRETGPALTYTDGTTYYIRAGQLREIAQFNGSVLYIEYKQWGNNYLQVSITSETTHETFYNAI